MDGFDVRIATKSSKEKKAKEVMAVLKFGENEFEEDPKGVLSAIKNVSDYTRRASPLTEQGKLHLYLIGLSEARKKFAEDTKSLPEQERVEAVLKLMNDWHRDNPPPKIVSKTQEALKKFDFEDFFKTAQERQDAIDFLGARPNAESMELGRKYFKQFIQSQKENEQKRKKDDE